MLDGYFRLSRPISDLATVFDMCGFASSETEEGLVLQLDEVILDATHVKAGEYRLRGELPEDACDIAAQIALALEADGIDFELGLYAPSGKCVKRLTSAG
jgi:hypothetical protein